MTAHQSAYDGQGDEKSHRGAVVPKDLPDVAAARLPASYEMAAKAIAECSRVDECKSWSDRAAALASYARQAKDDRLKVYAVRIQDRAIRRCGELLKQIPAANGANQNIQDGAVPIVTRTKAAEEAGLSERQRKTALRVASVPAEEFHRQVESGTPPSITRLAEQGKSSRTSVKAEEPDHGRFASDARDALMKFAKFCEQHEPAPLAKLFESHEAPSFRRCVSAIDRWLDQFVTHLGE